MSNKADPVPSPNPPVPSQLSVLAIVIESPTNGGTAASPLTMSGWFEPRQVDEVKVWYTRSDGSNGEAEVTPNQSDDPNEPDRKQWTWTFANNMTSGQGYIARARVKKGLAEENDQVSFTAQ